MSTVPDRKREESSSAEWKEKERFARLRQEGGDLHEEVAHPAGVGPDAGDVVLEARRHVLADAAREAEVLAVAAEILVGADVHVPVDLRRPSLYTSTLATRL